MTEAQNHRMTMTEGQGKSSIAPTFSKQGYNKGNGTVSIRRLILSYTMEQVILNICNRFQKPRCSFPEKSLTPISLCITLE